MHSFRLLLTFIIIHLITVGCTASSAVAFFDARTVIVKGYGATPNQALEQAKRNAVEQVTGIWITAETTVKNGKTQDSTASYTAGVLESFKITEVQANFVVIEAVVVDRNRKQLESSSATLSRDMQSQIVQARSNESDLIEATASLDHVHLAFDYHIKKLKVSTDGDQLTVSGVFKYRRDWTTQYREVMSRAGKALVFQEDLYNCMYRVNLRIEIYSDSNDLLKVHEDVISGNYMTGTNVPHLGYSERVDVTISIADIEWPSRIEAELYCAGRLNREVQN